MSTEEQFRAWCRRLKASDRSVFEEVFHALHEALFRYALYITRDAAAARDVSQEAFLHLWEMRAALDANQSLKALLYRIVRNRAYNYQRNRRTHAAAHALLARAAHAPSQNGPALPDALLQAKTLEARLQGWIDELPARQREALVLSRFESLSHAEIAAIMDISPHTVNNHIVQALKTLRDRIRAFEPDLLPS